MAMRSIDKVRRSGSYLVCPKCGSQFVEYAPGMKKFKCLESGCGWVERKSLSKKELKGYNFLSGTFTSYSQTKRT
jgi:hypothetical protein